MDLKYIYGLKIYMYIYIVHKKIFVVKNIFVVENIYGLKISIKYKNMCCVPITRFG